MTEISKEDKRFCRPCVYCGKRGYAYHNLCDYILLTGRPRGCPPGVGCTERKRAEKSVKPAEMLLRVCEICGKRYEGGERARLCQDCRKARWRQCALDTAEKRKTKKCPKTVQASQGAEIN